MRIDLILLAAGNSRRFGSNKLLYEWEGKPLYRHMLDRLLHVAESPDHVQTAEAEASERNPADMRVLVVTQYQAILDAAAAFSCKTVYSPDSVYGMSRTIQAALGAAAEDAPDYAAFFTADMPCLTEERIRGFLNGFLSSGNSVGCGRCGGICGNPAVFSWDYADEFQTLTGDQGGKKILQKHFSDCFFFDLTEEEWRDIDKPEDVLLAGNAGIEYNL